ncbi:hypothetical protein TCAL_06909 [Tigriopus californicus]|uniref:Sodium-dependent nutrient amino acid transporter 1 n=1 Tax=Tigriopus californicus TaxID=6832 RepID=A0A553PLN8_TIGCA|nr:sodium- and chloride-dependent neutral and basic amino acid transporter B(0+)-like [Tigriopus californicus]TRY78597.1 hypothetical protein TCAL_06909 [Tigriopus californicus]|eukprot:TCALIF_06909-PA protein Name:"Similar to Slc6a5 Sodium- and chloride-dependent glycine transporter 2 (Mus musculus)" AED:0.01 eAED:0.01 QI:139/1/1/1/1/1/2/924/654
MNSVCSTSNEHPVKMKVPHLKRLKRLSLGGFSHSGSVFMLNNEDRGSHETLEGIGILEYLTESRGFWKSRTEFIFAGIAYCVGVGNIWRFPQKVLIHGDGLYLIPYLVMLAVLGLPMVYLETTMAQFSKSNLVNVWRCCPILKGVGISMMTMCTLMHTFYPVIVTYGLIYAAYSVSSLLTQADDLPWVACPGDSCGPRAFLNITNQSRAELFWEKSVIMREDLTTWTDLGSFSLPVAVGLVLTWFMVFFSVRNGLESTKKTVFFIVPMTSILLVTLLIRALTLPGASIGLQMLIPSHFEKLADQAIWKDATDQVMFSLGIAYGGIIVLSSYNSFHNSTHQDCVLICLVDTGVSLITTVIMYCVMGTYALETGTTFGETVKKNSGTPFVAFSEALSRMVFPAVWSVLFFTMLFLVGLASSFQTVLANLTTLKECWPSLNHPKVPLTAIACTGLFLLGLPLTTSRGSNLVGVIDFYGVGFPILVLAFIETMGFCYIYGIPNILSDIRMMEGDKAGDSLYYRITWFFLPIYCLVVIVLYIVNWKHPVFEQDQEYPQWTVWFGFSVLFLTFSPTVGWIMWVVGSTLVKGGSLRDTLRPEGTWSPALGRGCCDGCLANYRLRKLDLESLSNMDLCRQRGALCVSLEQTGFDQPNSLPSL